MSMITAPAHGAGRRGAVERAEYLIDRFKVAYEYGGGWTCGCAEFARSDACKHTREAGGRLAAQMRINDHLRRGSRDPFAFNDRTPAPTERVLRDTGRAKRPLPDVRERK